MVQALPPRVPSRRLFELQAAEIRERKKECFVERHASACVSAAGGRREHNAAGHDRKRARKQHFWMIKTAAMLEKTKVRRE